MKKQFVEPEITIFAIAAEQVMTSSLVLGAVWEVFNLDSGDPIPD